VEDISPRARITDDQFRAEAKKGGMRFRLERCDGRRGERQGEEALSVRSAVTITSPPPQRGNQALPAEASRERLRILWFGKAEHYEFAVIAAQGARERRRR
jgi:hypothetical protein